MTAIAIVALIVFCVLVISGMLYRHAVLDSRLRAESQAADRAHALRKEHMTRGTLPCEICGHDPRAAPVEVADPIRKAKADNS